MRQGTGGGGGSGNSGGAAVKNMRGLGNAYLLFPRYVVASSWVACTGDAAQVVDNTLQLRV